MLGRIRILHISDLHFGITDCEPLSEDGGDKSPAEDVVQKRNDRSYGLPEDIEKAIDAANAYFVAENVRLLEACDEYSLREVANSCELEFDELTDPCKDLIEHCGQTAFDILVVSGDFLAKQPKANKHKPEVDLSSDWRRLIDKALEWVRSFANGLGIPHVIIANGNHDLRETVPDERWSAEGFIASSNEFYIDQSMPISPELDEGAYARLKSFCKEKIGFPYRHARLGFLAINSEPIAKTDGANRIYRAFLSDELKRNIHNVLETTGALFSDDNMLIVVGHTPIASDQLHALPAALKFSGFGGFLRKIKTNAYFCGHLHSVAVEASTSSESKFPWASDTTSHFPQFQCGSAILDSEKKGSLSFLCHELLNHYPGPVTFGRTIACLSNSEPEPEPNYDRIAIPDLPEGWSSWLCSFDKRTEKGARFRRTLKSKIDTQQERLRGYTELLTEDAPALVPYVDVYSRYFKWIMETAEPTQDGPSDIVYVCHQGPFSDFLNEPMNCDYLFQQINAVKLGQIRIVRLWLQPEWDDRSVPTPEHVCKAADRLGITLGKYIHLDAPGLAIGGAAYNGRHDTYQNCNCSSYETFVLTEPLRAALVEGKPEFLDATHEIPGVNLWPTARHHIWEYLTESGVVQHILAKMRIGESAPDQYSVAFCRRGDDVLQFGYAPQREDRGDLDQTMAEIRLFSHADLKIGRSGEHEHARIYRLIHCIDSAPEDVMLDALKPKTRGQFVDMCERKQGK